MGWSFLGVFIALLLGAVVPSFGTGAPPQEPPGAVLAGAKELPGLRTANSRTFANPDGTRVAEVHPEPINYPTANGKWAPIDDSIVEDGPSGYRNKANSISMRVSKTLNAPVRLDDGDASMSFDLVGVAPSLAVIDGNTARYADVFPGVDVEYTMLSGSLKEDVVLKSAQAQSSFSYRLKLSKGLSARLTAQQAVEVADATGKIRFTLTPPVLEDSSGTPEGLAGPVKVTLVPEAGGFTLTYAADKDWLAAPERVFPVRLDPTVLYNSYYSYVVQGGVTYDLDCFITDAPPTTTRCANTSNTVGYNGTNKYRALAIFPLTSGGGSNAVIPADAEILDGWFLMKPVGSVPKPLSVHEVTTNWNATLATWTKATSTTNWTSPGASSDYKADPIDAAGALRPSVNCTAPNTYCGWEEWSITEAVQKWVRDPASNRGLLVKQVDESQLGLAGFNSSNATSNLPTLWVNYRAAPVGAYPADEFVSETLNDRMGLQVNVATGNLMVQANDLTVAGTGLDLAIRRTFNSRSEGPSPNLGEDWMLDASLDIGLRVFPDGDATFFGPSGYAATFQRQSNGTYKAPARLDATLVSDLSSTGTLTMNATGEVYRFQGGTLASHEDRYGNAISFDNSATPTLDVITDTQNRDWVASHDAAGRITKLTLPGANPLTDPPIREVAYRYNASGRLDRFTDGGGNFTDYAYNGSGELVTITDPMGRETAITYMTSNGVRKVASFSRTLNLTGPVVATTSFVYSSDVSACPASAPDDPPAAGKTTVTGPTGVATTYCWDAANRSTKVSDAAVTTTSTWTDADTPDTITMPGGTTNNDYYVGDLLLKDTTDPTGAKTQFEYGAASAPHDPTKVTDPSGIVTFYAYDADGNRCLVRHDRAPQGADLCADTTGAFAHLVYNANGTLASATDANGNTTTYGYDGSGRLTATTPPSPLGVQTRTYDALGRVITMTDGNSQTTTATYDALDRVILLTHQDGSQVSYTYDANGNRLTETDAAGTVTTTYDRFNRPTSETPPSGPQVTYTYDLVGHPTSVADAGGTVGYQYGGTAGRLSSLIQPDSSQISFGYDSDGNRNQVSYPNGVNVTTVFDGAGKKTSVTATKGTATLSSFVYSYDVAGLHTDVVQTETDMNGFVTSYSYASPGRLIRAQTKNSGGTITEDYQYVYDAAGNRTSQDVNGSQITYSYNGANELTQAGSTTYSYDANGNLTGSSGGFGAAYNAKDQTSSMTPAGGSAVSMSYRGAGQQRRTQDGVISFGLSLLGVASTSDLSGDRYYTRSPEGELLAQRSAGGSLYYLTDLRGSVTGLTDGSGTVVATYRYDPFGNTTATTGVVSNRWRFTGEFFDADTGLYKIGARYYNPQTATWTQRDPLEDVSNVAVANPYAYAAGDPINRLDPSGCAPSGRDIAKWAGCVGRCTGGRCASDGVHGCMARARDWRAIVLCVVTRCGWEGVRCAYTCAGRQAPGLAQVGGWVWKQIKNEVGRFWPF